MIKSKKHIVFDLDDTLFKEIDFVNSAYIYINNYIKNKFGVDLFSKIEECLENKYSFYDLLISKLPKNHDFTIQQYLNLYRFHYPSIVLSEDAKNFIDYLLEKNIDYSIITDGRSISQRNKISALGLDQSVKNIIISDETGYQKTDQNNFKLIEKLSPDKEFIYIGDNTKKDFYIPNKLDWLSVCLLDNGRNIHPQDFNLPEEYLPAIKIKKLTDLNYDSTFST